MLVAAQLPSHFHHRSAIIRSIPALFVFTIKAENNHQANLICSAHVKTQFLISFFASNDYDFTIRSMNWKLPEFRAETDEHDFTFLLNWEDSLDGQLMETIHLKLTPG